METFNRAQRRGRRSILQPMPMERMTSLSVRKRTPRGRGRSAGSRARTRAFWPSRVFKFMGWAVGRGRENERERERAGVSIGLETNGRDNSGRRALCWSADRAGEAVDARSIFLGGFGSTKGKGKERGKVRRDGRRTEGPTDQSQSGQRPSNGKG